PGWSGAYAELAVVDAAGVHPLPSTLSYGQGAAVGVPCVTAWRALFQKAGLRPGETVLIHGASGGVGVPATQLASDAGAAGIGTPVRPRAPAGRRRGRGGPATPAPATSWTTRPPGTWNSCRTSPVGVGSRW